MATIGTFSQKDGKWTGTIRTMTINVKAQMVPVTEKAEGGPDYRIFAGGAELGAMPDAKKARMAKRLILPSSWMTQASKSRSGQPSSSRKTMTAASWSGTARS